MNCAPRALELYIPDGRVESARLDTRGGGKRVRGDQRHLQFGPQLPAEETKKTLRKGQR